MCPNQWPSWQNLPVVNCHSIPQWYCLSARLHDSIWVHLCPGSPHHLEVAHRSVVCYLQHQVPSCSNIEFLHPWEEGMADLWGGKGVSDPGVPNSVLTYNTEYHVYRMGSRVVCLVELVCQCIRMSASQNWLFGVLPTNPILPAKCNLLLAH